MSNKKNILLNIVIVILTIVLFILLGTLAVQTVPHDGRLYSSETAETLTRYVDRQSYNYLVQARHCNEMLGIFSKDGNAYTVPYAASDYYEAALNYKGCSQAGDTDGAAKYKERMDKAKDRLGQYTYIADDIDEFLN